MLTKGHSLFGFIMASLIVIVVDALDMEKEITRLADCTGTTTVRDLMRHIKKLSGVKCSQQRLILAGDNNVLSGAIPMDALVRDGATELTLSLIQLQLAFCFQCAKVDGPSVKNRYCSICTKCTFCSRRCWLRHVRSDHLQQQS